MSSLEQLMGPKDAADTQEEGVKCIWEPSSKKVLLRQQETKQMALAGSDLCLDSDLVLPYTKKCGAEMAHLTFRLQTASCFVTIR